MVNGIFHTGVTVSNLDKAITFYRDILGLEMISGPTYQQKTEDFARRVGVPEASLRLAIFKVGNGMLELLEYLTPAPPIDKPMPPNAVGATHVAFLVNDIESKMKELRSKGVTFLSDIKVEEGDLNGWKWVYFVDGDGIVMELVQYDQIVAN